MVIYQYKAINFSGQKVSGEMEASNAIDLESRLTALDLLLLRCSEKKTRSSSWFSQNQTMTQRDLIYFTFQLESMIAGGTAILDGLRDIRDSAESVAQQYAAGLMVEAIQSGLSFSAAMEAQPHNFPPVYISLVRTGELSGSLDKVLHELTETLKWQDELSSQVKRLFIYPSIIFCVVLGAAFFALFYMVPNMKTFITKLGQELPWHTKIVLWFSDFLVAHWYSVLGIPIILIILIAIMVKTMPPIALLFDRLILDMPLFGNLLRKVALTRLASMFALMYGAGVSILDALQHCEQIVDNLYLSQAVNRVHLLVTQGTSLADGFARTALFPPLVVRMIKVGENTGKLESSFRTLAYFYQRDIRELIDKVLKSIEPALIIFLGFFLLIIIVSTMLPIYDSIIQSDVF